MCTRVSTLTSLSPSRSGGVPPPLAFILFWHLVSLFPYSLVSFVTHDRYCRCAIVCVCVCACPQVLSMQEVSSEALEQITVEAMLHYHLRHTNIVELLCFNTEAERGPISMVMLCSLCACMNGCCAHRVTFVRLNDGTGDETLGMQCLRPPPCSRGPPITRSETRE